MSLAIVYLDKVNATKILLQWQSLSEFMRKEGISVITN